MKQWCPLDVFLYSFKRNDILIYILQAGLSQFVDKIKAVFKWLKLIKHVLTDLDISSMSNDSIPLDMLSNTSYQTDEYSNVRVIVS